MRLTAAARRLASTLGGALHVRHTDAVCVPPEIGGTAGCTLILSADASLTPDIVAADVGRMRRAAIKGRRAGTVQSAVDARLFDAARIPYAGTAFGVDVGSAHTRATFAVIAARTLVRLAAVAAGRRRRRWRLGRQRHAGAARQAFLARRQHAVSVPDVGAAHWVHPTHARLTNVIVAPGAAHLGVARAAARAARRRRWPWGGRAAAFVGAADDGLRLGAGLVPLGEAAERIAVTHAVIARHVVAARASVRTAAGASGGGGWRLCRAWPREATSNCDDDDCDRARRANRHGNATHAFQPFLTLGDHEPPSLEHSSDVRNDTWRTDYKKE
jgi:hypothetical protein